MRFMLETLAGIVGGLVSWVVVGFVAAQVLTTLKGDREGAAAMGGFFVIGALGGVVGFAVSFWLARRYLERGATTPSTPTFVAMLLAFALVLGLGWGVVSILSAVLKPAQWADLDANQKAGFEFRVRMPERLLGGKPVSALISLDFERNEDEGNTVTPVQWTEKRSRGEVTLSGHVEIERRPREQYFVLKQGSERFEVYAKIPPDMRKASHWDDEIYLGHDGAVPMADRVSFTCRYVPSRR